MKYFGIFLVCLALSGCQAYDQTRRPTNEFMDWVTANHGCPKEMKGDENVTESKSHSFTLDRKFYVDSNGDEAGFARGNVRYNSSCRLRSNRTRVTTKHEPQKNAAEVAPQGSAIERKLIPSPRQQAPAANIRSKLVPGKRPKLQPEAEIAPVEQEEPASQVQEPLPAKPKSILTPEKPDEDPIDCIRQPDGECLWIK